MRDQDLMLEENLIGGAVLGQKYQLKAPEILYKQFSL
jgi:hypothetical protein